MENEKRKSEFENRLPESYRVSVKPSDGCVDTLVCVTVSSEEEPLALFQSSRAHTEESIHAAILAKCDMHGIRPLGALEVAREVLASLDEWGCEGSVSMTMAVCKDGSIRGGTLHRRKD